MEFYNVKSRQKVNIADSKCVKVMYSRKTSTGKQFRYAAKATDGDGMNLTKFITKEVFDKLACPEVKPAKK